MAEPSRRNVLVATAIGFCAAFLLSGAGLLLTGYRSLNRELDCAGMSADECVMEQDIVHGWARYQVGFGVGLAGLGAALGLVLWLGERRSAAKE